MAWHGMACNVRRPKGCTGKTPSSALAPAAVSHWARWVVGSAPRYRVRGALYANTAAVSVARLDLITFWGSPGACRVSASSGRRRGVVW